MLGNLSNFEERNYIFYRCICTNIIKQSLKRMMNSKAVEPDNVPIEAWKCIGEEDIFWLMKLFNVIIKEKKKAR